MFYIIYIYNIRFDPQWLKIFEKRVNFETFFTNGRERSKTVSNTGKAPTLEYVLEFPNYQIIQQYFTMIINNLKTSNFVKLLKPSVIPSVFQRF